MTICLDFDGVIHNYSKGWDDGTIYDGPVEGAREFIERVRSEGHKVVILTARKELLDICHWLLIYNIKVDDVTNIKPIANIYIDDRGLRFTNWRDISNYF